MSRLANITLLCYILWIVGYNILGQPDTWIAGYYFTESIFMAMAVLFMAVGVTVKRWLAFEIIGYLIFRSLFVFFMDYIVLFQKLNNDIWFMRFVGVILLIIIFINRKK